MSRPDVEGIKIRVDNATEGPWRSCVWDAIERPRAHKDVTGQTSCRPPDLPLTAADADFIAQSREDIPALIAYIEELERIFLLP